jgi:hypothetical protein
MELWGIGADMDACLRARHIITKKLKELEKEAYRLAGKNFSLNATADIADILYTHLKLPVPKGCEKGKLHPSTDKQSLDHLRYFFIFLVSSDIKHVISSSLEVLVCHFMSVHYGWKILNVLAYLVSSH